ncbi:hypothetical protein W822_05340 [Advenella kashmirensis W13003]|uniref:Uncharacterized protein n=1 Tax=Advenella kashmirensis W13003 TaxID=1424334 RepID=V8QXW3_9BURK|nr:hypothetical protein W822_05340 [Advenella kashmirensis W13003]
MTPAAVPGLQADFDSSKCVNHALLTLAKPGVPCAFIRVERIIIVRAPWQPARPLQQRNIDDRNRKCIDDK